MTVRFPLAVRRTVMRRPRLRCHTTIAVTIAASATTGIAIGRLRARVTGMLIPAMAAPDAVRVALTGCVPFLDEGVPNYDVSPTRGNACGQA
jgi:hypothetical protein